jgi:hypothetical protein
MHIASNEGLPRLEACGVIKNVAIRRKDIWKNNGG